MRAWRYGLGFLVCWIWAVAAIAADLPDFVRLAEKAGPAVVNISTRKVVENPMGQLLRRLPRGGQGDPFQDFFDQFERFFGDQMPNREQRSLGSGFIISADGYIVTNNHVVEGADSITVNIQRREGKEESYDAEVVGTDPETDLALIKINATGPLPVLEFGDSDRLRVGEWVMAIGNPFGLDHTVTAGIVSAKGRNIGSGPYDSFIQTDASINPGNSGGPLINGNGEVIGINTAIIASGQGIGFAIPSNWARQVIDQLRQYKSVRRGWLGVSIQDVDEKVARTLGLSKAAGALVASVTPGDPADKAGIHPGDVIIALNGEPVASSSDLTRRVGTMAPGEKVEVSLWRKGKVEKVTVTLEERNSRRVAAGSGANVEETLGMKVRPVTRQEARALQGDGGLMVEEVARRSLAAQAGIRPGDVLLEANGQALNSVEDLAQVIAAQSQDKGALMLLVQRGRRVILHTIPLS
ncbi:MAG: DegQ family serine endoprotease [Desulfomicrobiaceae bacterium]